MKNGNKYITLDKKKDTFLLIHIGKEGGQLHTQRFMLNTNIFESAFMIKEAEEFYKKTLLEKIVKK